MVTEFYESIGYEECNSAIIDMDISAAQLEKGDYEWFEETFGDFGETEWKGLKREMEQRRKRCLMETTLYGWGSNAFGQLAHPKVQTANTPVKIEIPDAFSLDQLHVDINSVQTIKPIYLEDIVCSGRMSGLISSAGDLWMCGNVKDLEKKKVVEEEKLAQ